MRKLLFLSISLFTLTSFAADTTSTETATATDAPAEAAPKAKAKKAKAEKASKGKMQSITKGLEYEDLKVGTGAEAKAGNKVTVHYTGWLTNGTKFDSSVDRGQPFVFPLGGGQVIQGWDKGFAGMKVGGKRKLYIDPEMGYGSRGAPPVIPPNSKLIFEVELLGVN